MSEKVQENTFFRFEETYYFLFPEIDAHNTQVYMYVCLKNALGHLCVQKQSSNKFYNPFPKLFGERPIKVSENNTFFRFVETYFVFFCFRDQSIPTAHVYMCVKNVLLYLSVQKHLYSFSDIHILFIPLKCQQMKLVSHVLNKILLL